MSRIGNAQRQKADLWWSGVGGKGEVGLIANGLQGDFLGGGKFWN